MYYTIVNQGSVTHIVFIIYNLIDFFPSYLNHKVIFLVSMRFAMVELQLNDHMIVS